MTVWHPGDGVAPSKSSENNSSFFAAIGSDGIAGSASAKADDANAAEINNAQTSFIKSSILDIFRLRNFLYLTKTYIPIALKSISK